MTGDERIIIHEDLSAILDVSSGWMYDDLLRQIGWGVIKLLVWLNDWIEGVATKIITLGGLYNSPDMKEFMEMMQPLAVAFFVVSITVVGFLFMLNKIEKRNEVVMNVLVAIGVIVILPNLMTIMEDILDASLEHVDDNSNLSKNVLKQNIADVKYYVDSGFNYADGLDKETTAGDKSILPHPPHPETNKIGTTNYTFGNQLKYPDAIDVTEKLDIRADEGWFKWTTDDWVNNVKDIDGGYEFLTEKLVYTGNGGHKALKKLSKNSVPATNLGQQSYYRYHVNWAIAIATLAVTGFALVITVLKIGRSMFDLAFHQVYALFTASTDITGGQRLKKVLTEIVSTFAVVFVMMVLLKLFIIYAQWASDLEQNIGVVGVIILLIAGAWALIDAPDIVQRTLGIDAGLRSGWQQMMGAYAGMRMAGAGGKMIGKGTGKLTSTAAKGVGGGGASLVGGIKGMRDGMLNNKIPSRHAYHKPNNNQKKSLFENHAVDSLNSDKPNTIPAQSTEENQENSMRATHKSRRNGIEGSNVQKEHQSIPTKQKDTNNRGVSNENSTMKNEHPHHNKNQSAQNEQQHESVPVKPNKATSNKVSGYRDSTGDGSSSNQSSNNENGAYAEKPNESIPSNNSYYNGPNNKEERSPTENLRNHYGNSESLYRPYSQRPSKIRRARQYMARAHERGYKTGRKITDRGEKKQYIARRRGENNEIRDTKRD